MADSRRDTSQTRAQIRRLAYTFGFDVVGFTHPELPSADRQGLQAFLQAGHHGTMGWMAEKEEFRCDPAKMWPEVRTVLVLGMNYGPDHDPLERLKHRHEGVISVYAQGKDYHKVMKGRMKELCKQLKKRLGGDFRVYVDTAPVMEKPLAAQTALGWQGKHTCLVSRKFGSWLFLGEIFTSLILSPDPPETDHCGSCTRCLDICPTNAFPAPGVLDARRCISYLTIEHKGQIPLEFRKAMGNRIYGCDDCLAVCPWNKFARTAGESAFHLREALRAPLLAELAQLDDAGFRAMFSGSPVKRIGRDRFVRNVLVAIGNSEDLELLPVAARLTEDHSELVREMAVWAMGELQALRP